MDELSPQLLETRERLRQLVDTYEVSPLKPTHGSSLSTGLKLEECFCAKGRGGRRTEDGLLCPTGLDLEKRQEERRKVEDAIARGEKTIGGEQRMRQYVERRRRGRRKGEAKRESGSVLLSRDERERTTNAGEGCCGRRKIERLSCWGTEEEPEGKGRAARRRD